MLRGKPFQKGHIPWDKGIKRLPLLETIKKKISKALKGKPKSEAHKINIKKSRNSGRFKKGCLPNSGSFRKGGRMSGVNHWCWRGGISPLGRQIRNCFEYRQWRSDIFTKDDFTCQFCGKRGGNLEVDHYPKKFSEILGEYNIKTLEDALSCEELWNINNGRTLCEKCHRPKIGE